MARSKKLNTDDVAALGAERLAELLVEIAANDATTTRRLRLEVAGARGPEHAAREVRKRINTIRRSRSFVERRRVRHLVTDLELLRRTIVEQVAVRDPSEGLGLMWRFVATATSIFDRIDDSDGMVIGTFHAACADLGRIAVDAKADPRKTADLVYEALEANDFGQYDYLIAELAPALGNDGLTHLQSRMMRLRADEPEGIYSTTRMALMQIADARGDVDAFVAQFDAETLKVPRVSAEIAQRLLGAGRAEEALEILDAAQHRAGGWLELEWEDTRIAALDALGRGEEAQAARWSCFERRLSQEHLRDYLQRYAGFDGVDVERRALDAAKRHGSVHSALSFLVSWPAPAEAAALVGERADELDGDYYNLLGPAAEALALGYPLAATLLLRAMIDFALGQGRSTRYRHAARHLRECESLAWAIGDFGAVENHEEYVARLRSEHGRKTSFWKRVDEE